MNKLEARKMTTVYFIKLILVVCVALDSNKNLQKIHIYKNLILILFITLDLFFTIKCTFSPFNAFLTLQTFIIQCNLLKDQYFFVLNICIFFFKYTTYTTFIVLFSVVYRHSYSHHGGIKPLKTPFTVRTQKERNVLF